jgi:hypothetical protein
MAAMDVKQLTKKLEEAERELDTAKKLTEVALAAARYMHIKEALRRLGAEATSSA